MALELLADMDTRAMGFTRGKYGGLNAMFIKRTDHIITPGTIQYSIMTELHAGLNMLLVKTLRILSS